MRTMTSVISLRIAVLACACVVLLAAACGKREAPAAPAAPATKAPPVAATVATPAPAPKAAPVPADGRDRVFVREELDQMVAPIALYPDPLLAQVLMAATYPGDVADAAKWSRAHPDAKGDAAVREVANEPWDPSVQSLVAFPQALATLGQDPGWVQRLGDAFLAQPDDVMDAEQGLRRKAQEAGTLETNEYQKVSVAPAEAAPMEAAPAAGGVSSPTEVVTSPTIIIEPADPQVVYVPSYNPTTAYGTWAYPSYPPPYYPPPAGYYAGSALVRGIAFGTGLAIADSLWGDVNWGGDDIDINVSHYNNINTNRQINSSNSTWRHDSLNRDGVPYRDRASRDQFANRLPADANRDRFRGDDAKRTQDRERARASMAQRGVDAPARTNREARDRAAGAQREHAAAAQRDRAAGAQRDRAAAAQRDRAAGAQRDRAAGAQRDRANAGQRDRAAAAQRDRANAGQRDRASAAQRQQASRHRQQGASNNASRNQARQRSQAQSRNRSQNNAFAGSRQPQQSRAASQRGQQSHASANRGGGRSQGGGHQVNRQAHGGGQRSAAAHSGGGRRR